MQNNDRRIMKESNAQRSASTRTESQRRNTTQVRNPNTSQSRPAYTEASGRNSFSYHGNGNNRRRRRRRTSIWKILLNVLSVIIALVLALVLTLYIALGMLCSGKVEKDGEISEILYITVPTFLETGMFKFIPSMYLSNDDIQTIVDSNKMADMDADVDEGLINIGGGGVNGVLDVNVNTDPEKEQGSVDDTNSPIEIHEVSGATYYGTMMVVKDPSRVSLATIYPWRDTGVTLDELVTSSGAVGGINGGLYNSNNNTGGRPYGVIVCDGEIQLNEPQSFNGLVLVGFTENDILQIIDISEMNAAEVEALVAERKIRDAVTFQDEASDSNNHFVQLIINGEIREMNGMGSGLNPRTVIGQRADGAVLMFVTDGRGKSGHLGASASDLIEVMREFGAVNAANLDGGSSSCMYYDGEYLMTSVTVYYSNSSWKLPAGVVVK